MAHWIAYDEPTAASLKARTHNTVETVAGDPIDALLGSTTDAMALLPHGDGLTTTVTVRRRKPSVGQRRVIATGFLGLSDEIEEEEEAQPKTRWQRFWGQ